MNMNHDQFVAWLALEGFELKVHHLVGDDAWRIVPMQYPESKAKEDPKTGYHVPVIKMVSGRWVYTDDAAPHCYIFSRKKLTSKNIACFIPQMLEKLRYEP